MSDFWAQDAFYDIHGHFPEQTDADCSLCGDIPNDIEEDGNGPL